MAGERSAGRADDGTRRKGCGVSTAVAEIIERMRDTAAPGLERPDEEALSRLRSLTQSLIAAKTDARSEHDRFVAVQRRGLCLPDEALTSWLGDATILVTGGTGCIGSVLLAQLAGLRPARLVSVSRGVTKGAPRAESTEYVRADIRDRRAMDALMNTLQPDVVFHLAAQRQPALAEVEVHRSVSTNVLGTRNILESAAEAGVRQVVYASTGKALRPYSPETYTASKRAAEWLASEAAASGEMLCSAARFTHVMDNSIIHSRLIEWASDGVIRLHSPNISFYVQSALESAQLLLLAGLDAQTGERKNELRVHAITDLGWPVSLLDIALGLLERRESRTPIYFSGYDPGYEEISFPGLYDPATAGDVSPLLNAFETAARVESPCPMLDAFQLRMTHEPQADKLLKSVEEVCERTTEPAAVRGALTELSWSLLHATLSAAPRTALARAAAAVRPHEGSLSPDHRRMLEAIREHAAA